MHPRALARAAARSARSASTAAEHGGLSLTGPDSRTGIARLTLTNTRRTNPLSVGLMQRATRLLREELAPETRVLVLDAEPGTFFSSGHDLQDVFVREGRTGARGPRAAPRQQQTARARTCRRALIHRDAPRTTQA
jgi:enoyl-CoA hydratase/carnithine racemase